MITVIIMTHWEAPLLNKRSNTAQHLQSKKGQPSAKLRKRSPANGFGSTADGPGLIQRSGPAANNLAFPEVILQITGDLRAVVKGARAPLTSFLSHCQSPLSLSGVLPRCTRGYSAGPLNPRVSELARSYV